MSKLRLAVIGAGHLGKIHARLCGSLDQVELVGVTDPSDAARTAVREQTGAATYASHRQVLDKIDAAVVAAPTHLHAGIVTDLLRAGKHVFVEKPLADRAGDAAQLTRLANQHRVVLQVGHVERFNPAWNAALQAVGHPKYIEAVRASSFPGRCLDNGVVLDLMIHDLDLVLSVTDSPVVRVEASGLALVTDHEDLAEARLTFACGLVAHLKASRVSPTPARRMQVYGDQAFAEIDFGGPAATVMRPDPSILDRTFRLDQVESLETFRGELFQRWLAIEPLEIEPRNAILDELHDFVISIHAGSQPTVSGTAGARAVDVAEQVLHAIGRRQWTGPVFSPLEVGALATPRESILAASRRVATERRAA